MRFLALSGSLRAASINSAVLRACRMLAPPGIEVEIYDGLAGLPAFNPDCDVEPAPAGVAALRDFVTAADGVLIACPEYAHGMPGAFKNALDWLVASGELVEKPVGLLNAAPRASLAQASLADTLFTMTADLVEDARMTLPLGGWVVDGSGKDDAALAADETLAPLLRQALAALVRTVEARASQSSGVK